MSFARPRFVLCTDEQAIRFLPQAERWERQRDQRRESRQRRYKQIESMGRW
jgi:hypothetical protein